MRNIKSKEKDKIKTFHKEKVIKIILKIINIILWIITIYHIVFMITTSITKKEYMTIGNIYLVIMEDNSMQGELSKNDVAIIKEIKEKEKIEIGSVIGYHINDSIKISRVINIIHSDGETYYITKNDANYYENIEEIKQENIEGGLILKCSNIGGFLRMVQSPVTTIFIILFLGLHFKYNQYKNRKETKRKNSRIKIRY